MSGGDGNGDRGGLFFAVKKLLHHRSFFRSRGENHLSTSSPRKNSSPSSSIQRGTFSPSQSSLLSEESLPRNAGNELRFDIERISLRSSEDGLPNSVSSADEDSQQGHNRTTYASPVSSFTPCVTRNSSISSGSFQGEGSSPSHRHLCDGELFPTIAGDEQGFSDEIMSVKSSEGALENSDSHFSMLSLTSNMSSADEDSQHGHNQTTTASPASSCTPCVSRIGSISSGAHLGEGSSSSHPRPCYGESLPIISGDAQGFDTDRMLLKRFEDGLAISVSQFSTFPLMNHVSSANGNSQQGLNQTTTASPASSCTPRVSRTSSISFGALMNNVSSGAEDSQQGHNQTTSASPDSSCSLHVSRNSSISSSAYQGEGSSLSRPHSCSGEFLPIIACNELWFDDEIMSLESSQDRYKSMSSVHTQGYISVSPLSTISTDLRQSSFHSSAIKRESSPSRPRFSSDESLYGIPRYLLSFDMERNSRKSYEEWLTGSRKGSISSGNSSILRAAIGDGNQIHYFLSPVGLQSHLQSIFRRACESLVPRMISSSATEARAYRVEVENHIKKLVEDLQVTSTDVLRNAAAELQLLASLNTDNQILIANHGAISLLINLLHSVDTKLQESAVIALLHLSANDNNKCRIVDADAIEPLIRVLSTGSPEAQETSVATLFNLSDIEGFKVRICRAIKAVVELLANGTPRGKKDAATALYYLSILDEHKYRIVQAGAVKYLIELMHPDVGMVDEVVCILSNLSSISEGSSEICQEGGIPILVEVLKVGSSRAKEDAAVALLQLCTDNRQCCNMVLQLGAVSPLIVLSHSSNPRAQQLV
nr:U-box domain-containing protein 4-like isoform X1 [Ipomoea batatas]